MVTRLSRIYEKMLSTTRTTQACDYDKLVYCNTDKLTLSSLSPSDGERVRVRGHYKAATVTAH